MSLDSQTSVIDANRGLLFFFFGFDHLLSFNISQIGLGFLKVTFRLVELFKVLLVSLRKSLTLKFVDFHLKPFLWS